MLRMPGVDYPFAVVATLQQGLEAIRPSTD
jgi:hypothetical protein